MKFVIPYGKDFLDFDARSSRVLFTGEPPFVPRVADFKKELLRCLDCPISSPPLRVLAQGKKNILFLVEDATRGTPLSEMLPVITDYLEAAGAAQDAISFLTAPGTHRPMTERELREKLGAHIVENFRVYGHDATKSEELTDLGEIDAEGVKIPVRINSRALKADLLIGTGSIVPHSDAGFSGGAKIVQPGVCDFVTTQATHRGAGLCPDIPLGMSDGNPCRAGIDAVGKVANLAFIINIVKNYKGEVAGVFCGDYMKAHRAGVELARRSFGVEIEERADIVIASSHPADMDYWQGIKGLTCAYFAVKKGGAIILAAPCREGLVHNHPLFAHWLSKPTEEVLSAIKAASPYDIEADVVSAVVALGSRRVLDKAEVYMISEGLSPDEIRSFGYIPAQSVQRALDDALSKRKNATLGVLPLGGITFPILKR